MRALAPLACALLLATACAGDETAREPLADDPIASGPSEGERGAGGDPNAWPGQRAEPAAPRGGGGPAVVVARGGASGSQAAVPPDEPPPPQVDCQRIVDHIYEVTRKQAPGRPSAEARDREDQDRAALAQMCPARATAAYEACVLRQSTLDGILRCDPITGATDGTARALIEQANQRVELPSPDDPKPLPEPLDLPAPVIPQ